MTYRVMRTTMMGILAVSILAAMPGASLAETEGCAHEILASAKAPGGTWIAIVDETDCAAGMGGDEILDTVQLIPAGAPRNITNVVGVDTGGHDDERPKIAWRTGDTLTVTVPNLSLVNVATQHVGLVKVDVLFNPPDPKARSAWLKSLDLDHQ